MMYAGCQARVSGKVAPGKNKFHKTNMSHAEVCVWRVAVSHFLLFPRHCMNWLNAISMQKRHYGGYGSM